MTTIPTPFAFLATSLTGPDPAVHEPWEVALIRRRPSGTSHHDEAYLWQLPVDLGRAAAATLVASRFTQRRVSTPAVSGQVDRFEALRFAREQRGGTLTPLDRFARDLADLTWGATLVSLTPHLDEPVLSRLLRANGACPAWDPRPLDVLALVAGRLAARVSGSRLLARDLDRRDPTGERYARSRQAAVTRADQLAGALTFPLQPAAVLRVLDLAVPPHLKPGSALEAAHTVRAAFDEVIT